MDTSELPHSGGDTVTSSKEGETEVKMKWPIKASIAMTLVLFISACATQEEVKVEEATAEQTAEVAPAEAEVTSSTTTSPDTPSDEQMATKAETRATAQRDSEEKPDDEAEPTKTAEKEQVKSPETSPESPEPESKDVAKKTGISSPRTGKDLAEIPAGTPLTSAEVEHFVREYFKGTPVMIHIARCESTFRHTNPDGSVLRGDIDPRDIGAMQINLRWHGEALQKGGYNVAKLHDNLRYARKLHRNEGTTPWNASKNSCWQQQLASN